MGTQEATKPVRKWEDVPAPFEAIDALDGLALSHATNSFRLLAGTDGCALSASSKFVCEGHCGLGGTNCVQQPGGRSAVANRCRRVCQRSRVGRESACAATVHADACLPYHVVRPLQHLLRDRDAERLGGFQVDDQSECFWLLDRQVGGIGALEDLVDKTRRLAP